MRLSSFRSYHVVLGNDVISTLHAPSQPQFNSTAPSSSQDIPQSLLTPFFLNPQSNVSSYPFSAFPSSPSSPPAPPPPPLTSAFYPSFYSSSSSSSSHPSSGLIHFPSAADMNNRIQTCFSSLPSVSFASIYSSLSSPSPSPPKHTSEKAPKKRKKNYKTVAEDDDEYYLKAEREESKTTKSQHIPSSKTQKSPRKKETKKTHQDPHPPQDSMYPSYNIPIDTSEYNDFSNSECEESDEQTNNEEAELRALLRYEEIQKRKKQKDREAKSLVKHLQEQQLHEMDGVPRTDEDIFSQVSRFSRGKSNRFSAYPSTNSYRHSDDYNIRGKYMNTASHYNDSTYRDTNSRNNREVYSPNSERKKNLTASEKGKNKKIASVLHALSTLLEEDPDNTTSSNDYDNSAFETYNFQKRRKR